MERVKKSGLELLREQLGGTTAAPFEAKLGLTLAAADRGFVRFTARADATQVNSSGVIHGGWVSGLLDAVSGAALQTELAPAEAYTTISLHVSYLRAVRPDTTVEIEGSILKAGARIATSEARMTCEGRLVATATASCLRMQSGGS